MSEARRCRETLEGPKVGRNVVLWRRQCANKTKHPSGYCHQHNSHR